MSPADRRARVDRDDPVLAIVAQCRLLKIARSTLYYRPAPVDPDDLAVMRRMDELYLASPFYGICSTRLNDGFPFQHSANRLIRIEPATRCGANDGSNGSEKIGTPV